MRHFEKLRQTFIATHLKKHGHINRADIMEAFGISKPQASKDLQTFQRLNKRAIQYNLTTKRYEVRK